MADTKTSVTADELLKGATLETPIGQNALNVPHVAPPAPQDLGVTPVDLNVAQRNEEGLSLASFLNEMAGKNFRLLELRMNVTSGGKVTCTISPHGSFVDSASYEVIDNQVWPIR